MSFCKTMWNQLNVSLNGDMDMATSGRMHRICICKCKLWMDEGGLVMRIRQWVGLPLFHRWFFLWTFSVEVSLLPICSFTNFWTLVISWWCQGTWCSDIGLCGWVQYSHVWGCILHLLKVSTHQASRWIFFSLRIYIFCIGAKISLHKSQPWSKSSIQSYLIWSMSAIATWNCEISLWTSNPGSLFGILYYEISCLLESLISSGYSLQGWLQLSVRTLTDCMKGTEWLAWPDLVLMPLILMWHPNICVLFQTTGLSPKRQLILSRYCFPYLG